MKIALSAAETSGDLIASSLVVALKLNDSNCMIDGLAGDKMIKAGCHRLWHMNEVNVMGLSEVLRKLPSILKLRKQISAHYLENKPDIFIGVDSPDFNFKLERILKNKGIKTIHLISPSVWAWRSKRIKRIKESTDLILCLFPFEVNYYKQYNQKAVFVGHPLAEILKPRKNFKSNKNVLIMPGSRESEIKYLLPELLEAAKLDGTNSWKFFIDFLVPLSKTMIAAVFIFMFVYGYNQYLWPLIMTTTEEYWTVVMGLKTMYGSISHRFAFVIMSMIPPVLIIIFLQKLFIQGIFQNK